VKAQASTGSVNGQTVRQPRTAQLVFFSTAGSLHLGHGIAVIGCSIWWRAVYAACTAGTDAAAVQLVAAELINKLCIACLGLPLE
jgi:hypothetical protein